MQKRIIVLTVFSFAILFSLPFLAASQTLELNLLGGESGRITCEGSKLVFQRESKTSVIANCQPQTDNPGPAP